MPLRFALLFCLAAASARATDFVISDLAFEGFSYGYGNLDWQEGPTSTRIFSLDNGAPDRGWGGVVRERSMDLSWASDGRLIVDFTLNPGHATDNFLVHLNDADGRSGRWTFNVGGVSLGVPTQLTSLATIAEPDAVWFNGGFINTPPDLTRITSWAIEGQWASPGPFDVSLDNVLLRSDATPPPPYAGFEPDAPWRAEAATRIEAIRKADLTVQVVDAVGRPVPNAAVSVTQREHEFGFGTAVRTNRVLGSAPEEAIYRQKLDELFNTATIENRFKWQPWEGEWGPDFRPADALATLDWLVANGFRTRGHNLVWPGEAHLPQSVNALLGDGSLSASEQQAVRDAVAARIAELGAATNGKITAWDVVNEPRINRDIMDALPEGYAAMIDWFHQAAAADPNAERFLNDFGILTSGGATNTQNQQLLEAQARDLMDAGAPIDGVGLQGHFADENLTGPEQLWAIVDRYADLGLDVHVTEFDHNSTDEALQAAYLHDFYTAMFAHAGVSEISMWGFWEDAHWLDDAALFYNDWSIKPNGQAFVDLVYGEWWTDEEADTDESGEAIVRAFKGEHGVSVERGGEQVDAAATLSEGGETLVVTLDTLLGDYNLDGVVDAADYTLWRDASGNPAAVVGSDADGDNDGQIDAADFAIWQAAFGATLPDEPAPVPEPAAAMIAASLALLARRRQR